MPAFESCTERLPATCLHSLPLSRMANPASLSCTLLGSILWPSMTGHMRLSYVGLHVFAGPILPK